MLSMQTRSLIQIHVARGPNLQGWSRSFWAIRNEWRESSRQRQHLQAPFRPSYAARQNARTYTLYYVNGLCFSTPKSPNAPVKLWKTPDWKSALASRTPSNLPQIAVLVASMNLIQMSIYIYTDIHTYVWNMYEICMKYMNIDTGTEGKSEQVLHYKCSPKLDDDSAAVVSTCALGATQLTASAGTTICEMLNSAWMWAVCQRHEFQQLPQAPHLSLLSWPDLGCSFCRQVALQPQEQK